MTEIDRRTFLRRSAVATAGGAVLGGPFAGFVAGPAAAVSGTAAPAFRRLRPAPDQRDGAVRLHLPDGFSYRSFHEAVPGATLTDGAPIPGRHDGMAAFDGKDGHVVLVRNHEVNGTSGAFGNAAAAYDSAAPGGTTTVVVNRFGMVSDSFVSLNGTQMNCSGGPMPWGSWMTCEETINGPDVGPDFTGTPNTPLKQKHGYVFEVPAGGQGERRPIRSAGRFAHESVAYSPRENALYLSEDNFAFPSGFYRYLPPNNPMADGHMADGGRLQMLAVDGRPGVNLAEGQRRRATYRVHWVDIADPDPTFAPGTTNDQALVAVGDQGRAQGAAQFSRLEGCIFDSGVVYFTSTQGGATPPGDPGPSGGFGDGRGQVWAYHTASSTLQLLYESPSRDVLDFPDNVTTSPRGTLVLCEDGDQGNYLRGLTRGGQVFDFARNAIVGRENDEFAGSTFSPDGHTLFVNIQASRGMSFAIWGPWERVGF